MNKQYRLSVIIGIYNCANTIQEALDSLNNQTYTDFKVILCDDGSSDESYQILKSLATVNDNYLLLKNDKNMGLNSTLNRCLEFVDTEYVARMDGDDISLPERFQKEIAFLDTHPEYAMVSCPMIHFDENGDFKIGRAKEFPTKMDFVFGTPFSHAASMSRTAVIKEIGGYSVDNRLLRVEDYHLWMKLYAAGYRGYNLQEPLYKMRDDRNALLRRNWNNRKNEMYVRHIGFKMLKLPWYTQVYVLRPLIVHCLPKSIYRFFHKK